MRLTRTLLTVLLTLTTPALASANVFYDHAVALVFHPETMDADILDDDEFLIYRLDDGKYGFGSKIEFLRRDRTMWQLSIGLNSLTKADFGPLRQVYDKPRNTMDKSERVGYELLNGPFQGAYLEEEIFGPGDAIITITTASYALDQGDHREPDDYHYPLYDYLKARKS